jgi:AcrR family transcriptional regulator
MGINMPSLYAAFGNKEALFRKAVDRYLENPSFYFHKALMQPTARQVAEQLMRGAINMVMDPKNPDGCLLVHGALASGPDSDPIRKELNLRRAKGEAALRRRFELAVAQRDLTDRADPARLARYIITVIWGMSVQAAGGATRSQLKDIADFAMKSWPADS